MTKLYLNSIIADADKITQRELVKKVAESHLDIDGFELREEYFAIDENERNDEIAYYQRLAEEKGWDYYYSVLDEIFIVDGVNPKLEHYFQVAQSLNAKSIKMNTGVLRGLARCEVDDVNHLIDKYDIGLTIENGQLYTNGSIPEVRRALNIIYNRAFKLGFTFDLGNWTIVQEKPHLAFTQFKSRITTFQMKNVREDGSFALMDDGHATWQDYVHLDVPYMLEYPIHFDDLASEIEKFRNETA